MIPVNLFVWDQITICINEMILIIHIVIRSLTQWTELVPVRIVCSTLDHVRHLTPSTLSAIDGHVEPRVLVHKLNGLGHSILPNAMDLLDTLLLILCYPFGVEDDNMSSSRKRHTCR